MTFINTVFSGDSGNWSQTGCSVRNIGRTAITCECSHLTNIAIIMVHLALGYSHDDCYVVIGYSSKTRCCEP